MTTPKRAAKHNTTGNRPLKTRVFVIAVVLCCGVAATVSLFDRKELPATLRDNPYVAGAYKLRDRALQKGGEWMNRNETVADEGKKQQGYPSEDREKLEKIINKGAQGND